MPMQLTETDRALVMHGIAQLFEYLELLISVILNQIKLMIHLTHWITQLEV